MLRRPKAEVQGATFTGRPDAQAIVHRCCSDVAPESCSDTRGRASIDRDPEALGCAMAFRYARLSVRIADGRRQCSHPRFVRWIALRARPNDGNSDLALRHER